MSDRILLTGMRFSGHHGLTDAERTTAQPFEVDVELYLNLQPAAMDDEISKTVDYGRVFELCRELVEATTYKLLEAMAEGMAHEILMAFPVNEVAVRVRKLKVPLAGEVSFAAVEIRRARSADRHRE